ncbi:MAG: magnesium transporter [Clostridia bacterium]|nr:magnesium transporter [Clostridia bacterium]
MLENILELLRTRRYMEIRSLLEESNIVDVADLFDQLDDEYTVVIFRLLPKGMAADVFSYMETDTQKHIVESITDRELSGIIDELFLDDAVDFIEEMPANVVKRVLANTGKEKRTLINRFLKYEEDTAGSLMTIEFVGLKKEMTVRDAFDTIRRTGPDKETIYTLYVMDENRKLEGIVSAKDLLLAHIDEKVEDIMDSNVIYVSTDEDREEIANLFQKYDFLSLPVVDRERRLVGIITIDDAVEALQQENTEDFELMAAMTPSEAPYLKTGVFAHAKRRVLWLVLLMLSSIFAGSILTKFQDSFAVMPILVSFMPMLMNTGGNCGSQASTLIIRGLSLGEIQGRDALRVWWREIRIAVLCGIVLSLVSLLRIYFFYDHNFALGLVVAISLLATVIIAKSVGCLLPIGAKKLGLDPAIMASPIITTIVDICALALYFTVAKMILHI